MLELTETFILKKILWNYHWETFVSNRVDSVFPPFCFQPKIPSENNKIYSYCQADKKKILSLLIPTN